MSLFIGHISVKTTKNELMKLFSRYGKVLRCDIYAKYAFIDFEKESDARAAQENLSGYNLHGLSINVEWAKGSGASKGDLSKGDHNTCFKCGERGHWARECVADTKKRAASRSRSRSRSRSASPSRGRQAEMWKREPRISKKRHGHRERSQSPNHDIFELIEQIRK
eukprot:TRINITY_DN6188_c0_g1_i1.p1 TRINITY_DN6188_c0_g1~~TRINITY_DN6188_c0_g1_i1.p1  ORF type:complete len:166 (+),score=31.32 TRINITY_DN6188_c0_g1_i1:2-499(+)